MSEVESSNWPKILTVSYEFEVGGARVTTASMREFREAAEEAILELAQRYFVVKTVTQKGTYTYRGPSWSESWDVEAEKARLAG